MSTPLTLLLTVILLAGNAFFVGAELVVTPPCCSQLELPVKAGDARATTALWALQNAPHILATTQFGVALCPIGPGVVARLAIAHALEPLLAAVGIGCTGSHAVVVIIALVIVMGLHVVVGEMVSKNISIVSPEKAVRQLAPSLVWCSRVFGPVINAPGGFASGVLKVLGIRVKEGVVTTFNAEEVVPIVERSTVEGVLENSTGLLSGTLEFSEEIVSNVMVPLSELVTLAQGCTLEDVERAVASAGFSCFPLVANQAAVDQGEESVIIGHLHLKDILYTDGVERTEPIPAQYAHALVPVGYGGEIEETLTAMQRLGTHPGHVRSAQRCFVGVLFLEDILGELVGEVNDAIQREEHRRHD